MQNNAQIINVREILGVKEPEPRLFIKPVGPDRLEAAKRLAITEKAFEDWHVSINATNTRQLPSDLIELYDDAAYTLCKILDYERQIATDPERS